MNVYRIFQKILRGGGGHACGACQRYYHSLSAPPIFSTNLRLWSFLQHTHWFVPTCMLMLLLVTRPLPYMFIFAAPPQPPATKVWWLIIVPGLFRSRNQLVVNLKACKGKMTTAFYARGVGVDMCNFCHASKLGVCVFYSLWWFLVSVNHAILYINGKIIEIPIQWCILGVHLTIISLNITICVCCP